MNKIRVVVLLGCIIGAASCEEKLKVYSNDNFASSFLDTVEVYRQARIDTNTMLHQIHKIASINSHKESYSLIEYRRLYNSVNNENLAESLTNKVEIYVDGNRLVKDVYYTPENYGTDSVYIAERFIEYLPVNIKNISNQIVDMHIYNNKVLIVTEAKDESGSWRPIEYLLIDKNAYLKSFDKTKYVGERIYLMPNHQISILLPKYTGKYKTDMRLKLIQDSDSIFSNVYKGAINPGQFNVPERLLTAQTSQYVVKF